MGGLDIFKAKPQPDGSWAVQNLKPPINSFADDFGIAFEDGLEKGIFSSTRKGKGNDERSKPDLGRGSSRNLVWI